MKAWMRFAIVLSVFTGTQALGSDVLKKMAVELDPFSPLAASLETQTPEGKSASMWGGQVEFNMGNKLATGPEFWLATIKRQGKRTDGPIGREEEMIENENVKLEATRLRWMVGLYEKPMSLRGWFVKAGISYTKIQSRSNIHNEWETNLDDGTNPDFFTNNVTDVRQGVVAAVGQRWLFFKQSASLSLTASITANYKRNVSVDAEDTDAREDYDQLIEDIPGGRQLSAKPFPEGQVAFGYMF